LVFERTQSMRRIVALILLLSSLVHGCAPRKPPRSGAFATTHPTSLPGLAGPIADSQLDALCIPPQGWIAQPRRSSSQHAHQIWLSPGGQTAYGVIHFSLPLPVGEDLALWGFLREMRRTQGEAILDSKRQDPQSGAIDFVAEGGSYVIRVILLTRGFHGWAVYAGTLRNQPIVQDELELAMRARDNTALGLPTANASGRSVATGAAGTAPADESHPSSDAKSASFQPPPATQP